MITEVCQYLKNWFNRKPDGTDYPKYEGEIVIENGVINVDELAEGQYFRIMGSLFNDGVHRYGDLLKDETFNGSVWSMGIPAEVIELASDIALWQDKHGNVNSPSMSPFTSESFGGYSYSKSGDSASGSAVSGWQNVFAARLNVWRKI